MISLYHRLHRMIRSGTTLIEAKSGYGLELVNEIKMLKVLHRAQQTHPIDLVANYCGEEQRAMEKRRKRN